MKNFRRLIRYIKNYKSYAFFSILSNMFSVVFSLFSLTMIIPFLNILFNQEQEYTKVPWSFSVKTLLNNLNYTIAEYIHDHGKVAALTFICGLVVLMFFF